MPGHGNGADSSDNAHTGISRRKLLATVGTGSMASIAGCGGIGGNGTDTGVGDGTDTGAGDGTDAETGDGTSGGQQVVDPTYNAFYTLNPPNDLYFNPFSANVASGMGLYHWAMMWTGVAEWDSLNPERAMTGILAGHPRHTDPIEDGTATFGIREDLTWHNGDPYTAKDYETGRMMQLYIAQSTGGEAAIPYTDVRAVDDYTVEVDMRNPSTPHIPWWNQMYGTNLGHSCCTISNGPMWVKHSEWSDWRQQYEDASTEEEMDSITSELQNVQRPFEETIGYGPFQISEISGQTVVYEPWEEWPGLVTINWPDRDSGSRIGQEAHQVWIDNDMTAELTFHSERSVVGQAALRGELDFARLNSVSQGQQLVNQEGWAKLPQPGRLFSSRNLVGYHVNFDHPALAKQPVRKALLYLMNQQQLSQLGYENTEETYVNSPAPIPAPVGLSWGSAQEWLDTDAVKNNWETYNPQQADTETATSLLEEAGLSRSGGNWQLEDGSRFTVQIKQSSEGPVEVSRAFADQLESFGIGTEFTAIEGTLVEETLRNGDFDLFHDFDEGALGWPGTHFRESFQFLGQDYPWGSTSSKQVNHPDTWQVPSTIGDPDSETESFDPIPLIQDLNEAGNDHESYTRQLAWASNQTAPSLVYGNGEYTPESGDPRPVGMLYNANDWKADESDENHGLKIRDTGYAQHRIRFGAFEPRME